MRESVSHLDVEWLTAPDKFIAIELGPRVPLSLASTTEELLERKVAAPV
jgi:hypothetical protein